MKNKLGIYAYFGFDLTPSERFSLIKNAGINDLGIWRAEDFMLMTKLGEYEQTKLIAEYGFNITYAHAPIRLTPYLANKYYNKAETLKTYKLWLKGCEELHIPILVIHTPACTPDLIENLRELSDFANTCNVKIAVENIEGLAPFDEIFAAIDNIYFCFDSSHAALFGDARGEMALKYKDRLICTHLSDNDLSKDRHWMIGDGNIEWKQVASNLKKANYKGTINFEVFRSPNYSDAKSFIDTLKTRAEEYFA
ncbi:MAG: sugar phosphate isomerase/epimerase [Clostridia bacterium]|nr:sugar phosphate isomerase/epimerase [Clostridia bacterium]